MSWRKRGGKRGPRWSVLAVLGWSLIVLCPGTTRAQISMTIVGPGSKVSSIAISQLKNLAGDDDGAISGQFVDVLRRDLKLSGYFSIVPPASYIEDPQTSGYQLGKFNFADWSSLNTDFLIKGAVTTTGQRITLEAFLYDVAQQRQLIGKRFSGSSEDVDRMARRFADAVLGAVTGTPGPFDSRLAMASTEGGRFKQIYVSSPDGLDLFRVTNNPTINILPDFSSSGNRVLYLSYKSGQPALYLFNIATRREIRIRSRFGTILGGAAMPDGQSVVAAIERGGATNLFQLDLAGNELRQLTHGSSINVDPDISRDGKLMAFTSDRGGTPQIYVMNLGSGATRRITYRGSYNTDPAISPKGDRIAYQTRNGGFQICLIGINGGEPSCKVPGQHPAWSPDSRYLVFSRGSVGASRLYLMLIQGDKITGPLTKEDGNATDPAWSGWLGDEAASIGPG